jgi:uncharacterized protein (DUF2267 family)
MTMRNDLAFEAARDWAAALPGKIRKEAPPPESDPREG